jgi:hypothetical protein
MSDTQVVTTGDLQPEPHRDTVLVRTALAGRISTLVWVMVALLTFRAIALQDFLHSNLVRFPSRGVVAISSAAVGYQH